MTKSTAMRGALVVVIVTVLAVAGYLLRGRLSSSTSEQTMDAGSMATATAESTPRAEIALDTRRQQLIGVRIVTARRATLPHVILAAGLVRPDETRQVDVNVRLDGWIRDLYVDYTGQLVQQGQRLFTFYSRELLAATSEYVFALDARDALQQSPMPDDRQRAAELVDAARQRLAQWDLEASEIAAIEEARQPRDVVTFLSPAAGFVVEKSAVRGLHVTPGQTLYKIADLSQVWVEAEVYQGEAPLMRVGQMATVTLDAYPGEDFRGRVIYIYPYVDEQTRTNKVRFGFANRGGRLKPGMYATVQIETGGSEGVVVPANALLDSGKEQVVFVAKGGGTFEPRHVKAGRRSGDDVQILEGLKEGEDVAAAAAFFLDSESQLRGSLQGYEPPPAGAATAGASSQLDIAFRSIPAPPRTGENQFEVVVKDTQGVAVDGAAVTIQFFMPAMPTMNMPAIRNDVSLTGAGNGVYRGTGQVMMAGSWDATITVTRGGQRLGSRQIPVLAQ